MAYSQKQRKRRIGTVDQAIVDECIQKSAQHLATILNENLAPLLRGPVTADQLIFLLSITPEQFPVQYDAPTFGTVRGLGQRLGALQKAIQGEPDLNWITIWRKKAYAST